MTIALPTRVDSCGALDLDSEQHVASHVTALGQPFSAGDRVDIYARIRARGGAKATVVSQVREFVVLP